MRFNIIKYISLLLISTTVSANSGDLNSSTSSSTMSTSNIYDNSRSQTNYIESKEIGNLHKLVRYNDLAAVIQLSSMDNISTMVNIKGGFGKTALLFSRTAEMDEALLSLGADPAITNSFGNTHLLHLVQLNDLTRVEILLQYGADPAVTNKFGNTPLREAEWRNNSKMIYLLKHYINK
jgi:ankyrin repeat protein